ncbi:hypothetical protein DW097_24595 [Enterocloster clostridioformis]|uniref:hypothetical protein n=1 Tax=Enterocloster bolteae TaxID=208479 RepID=UPI000E42B06D|nr:hypothetical protein [Enterocloster bolteae]RGB82645.1 hypothetical protein DW097_24595 [Enterocloster clostridioformis]RGK78643.1 hypothetical protein DXC96_02905 [Enterocloster bolteae]
MAFINRAIVENIEASYIETYLTKNGFKKSDEEAGISAEDWVNSLIDKNKIDIDEFEKFLFQELMMGKRKLIRIYQIDNVKKIKFPEDWNEPLAEKYEIKSLNFNAILNTYVNSKSSRKIAAIHSEENEKGELTRLQILFVCWIEVNEVEAYRDSYAYIPVDIDFTKKIMLIKAWNRYGLTDENQRAEALLDHIRNIMVLSFHVSIRRYMITHKKVLYNMSKGLVDEVYNKIPAFSQISILNNLISNFEQEVLSKLPIVNIDVNEDGRKVIPKGVMEFSDEIQKALERLAVSDYFYNRSYEEIWDMGVNAVIAKIKFNDNENILTSLSGEESDKPIFCTKTFMYLKKSMEDSKLVERLWVVKNRNRGTLNVRYDATDEEYLGVMIRSGIRYTVEDLEAALEIYKNYESRTIKTIAKNDKRNVS